ncbi:EAL domain-containing protein [Rahnella victoriana]|uniref:EAL domain-containing protein n=1 Tax=Rahnella victoriana TaxID=1510570 RepID=UPI0013F155D6|nr:EAL domain-containing protein [Rahnella victoriana]UHM93221.1 EAL domain-containing protein [Rahnella victoriana]
MIIYNALLSLADVISRNKKNLQHVAEERVLQKTIKRDEFHPFIQPVFSADGFTLKGCEILLRVKSENNYNSPVLYIHEMEASRYRDDIICHLFQEIEKSFENIMNYLPEDFYFSFNITAGQISSHDVINAALHFSRTFKDAATLVLEVVERTALNFDDKTMQVIEHLVANDIRLAIDDFSAGSLSLKYIENIGLSALKIDKDLTQAINGQLVYENVIDAIMTLSSRLGVSVTADGIETYEQMPLLRKAGINGLQGDYLAEPMQVSEFIHRYIGM